MECISLTDLPRSSRGRRENLSRYTIGGALLLAVLLILTADPAFCLTCEQCKKIEKSEREYTRQETEKSAELRAAFEKGDYERVQKIKNEITELRKQLIEWRKTRPECREACRPKNVKAELCSKLKLEIVQMEARNSGSPEEIEKIDALYRSLRHCHMQLKKMLEKSR
jgi:chromosome segregation ATPase